ncbi:4'-phosphopantetheinyl transferase superfamily protein [Bacillus thermocopriae]|uniref:4'-phosphopantetheinyl transferase superfamily protein n=1 Tax=Neobacillus thermocopriae TaxID=1215031 RepID=A0A6B3TLY0_9BACI|nr:4'-phosphopantetheinyl transferase superfamily protein [Neobacillus thermocopriae]NEX77954.1 4'-phosphopantetheinyl transferase superfamily protein [Neobacillus thermocopriae]
MIQLFVCRLKEIEEELFHQLLVNLPKERQHHVLRFRQYEDRLRSMIGNLLMHMQLAKQLQCAPVELNYQVNQFGKYELVNQILHFNLSHAGQYVIGAISDRPVGIDLELKQYRDFSFFQSVWTEREKKLFEVDSMNDFYYLWTAKESYVKWLGTGLATDLKTVDIDYDGLVYQNGKKEPVLVQNIDIDPQYQCTVCSEYRAEKVKFLSIEQLITYFMEKSCSKSDTSFCF